MILNGDLSTFQPANLLMFFSQSGREGLLTVTKDDEELRIGLKDTFVVTAHSERSDGKILRALFFHNIIDDKQLLQIRRAKQETGLPLRLILDKLNMSGMARIQLYMEDGVREVLFQLFLMEKGQFNITDLPVEEDTGLSHPLDCRQITYEITRCVDEWHEIIKRLGGLDRVATATDDGRKAAGRTPSEKAILDLAVGDKTLAHIIESAPFPSFEALTVIEKALENKWIVLHRLDQAATEHLGVAGADQMFYSFKRFFKKVILSRTIQPKMANMISFCKDHFDQTVIITTRKHLLNRCMVFSKDAGGGLRHKDVKNINRDVTEDPVFSWVYQSNLPFFGKVFSTRLFDGIIDIPREGECAVIPLEQKTELSILIYAYQAKEKQNLNSFHYLELMSWLINPPKDRGQWGESLITRQEKLVGDMPANAAAQDKAALLVKAIDNLPPMPHVVTQVLQRLADPNNSMSNVTHVLSQDQALVARLIKVSNSAFYGTVQKISNLNQALARLGTKTIRSIVMTASTSVLFPKKKNAIGTWSKEMWQHSKECALAARRVAEAVGYPDPEEAFVGGLLHDIGKLVVLLKLPDDYRLILEKQTESDLASINAETEVLGFNHSKLGELLMQKWDMPPNLQDCVRYHHHPEESKQFKSLVTAISYGDYICRNHEAQTNKNGDMGTSLDNEYFMHQLHLNDAQRKRLHETIVDDFQHTEIFD